MFALFERDMQKLQQALEEKIILTLTPRARLEALLQVMFEGIYSKRIGLLYTIYNSLELRKIFVEKKGCMREIWEQLTTSVTSLLEEGKAAGEFDVTIPTSVMLSAFFSFFSPRSYERMMTEGQVPPDEVVKQIGRIYFKGIAAG